jgi:hypothetical protein
VLVPIHLALTAPVYILFYLWRKNIFNEAEEDRYRFVAKFLVAATVIYLLIYFQMFSRLV